MKMAEIMPFYMISSFLQTIGGFYLLPSISGTFLSRYGRFGSGWTVPRYCSFPEGLAFRICLQIIED